MTKSDKKAIDRRKFLTGIGGASTAALAATAIPAGEAQAYNPGPEQTRQRYRETDHVKAFYRTNGYETLKK
jgi:hypothetical protein